MFDAVGKIFDALAFCSYRFTIGAFQKSGDEQGLAKIQALSASAKRLLVSFVDHKNIPIP